MQFTLSKSERLGRRDFRRAKWKKCGSTAHFLLFESRNDTSRKRFGVVIQRKIKGVVARNRIRRLIKEFLRLNKHLFKDCHNYSVRVVRMPEKDSLGHGQRRVAGAGKPYHQTMRHIVVVLLKLYRVLVSPYVPTACRFYPSCSSYMIEAIEKKGIFRGVLYGLLRILKCNPFHPGGFDPVK